MCTITKQIVRKEIEFHTETSWCRTKRIVNVKRKKKGFWGKIHVYDKDIVPKLKEWIFKIRLKEKVDILLTDFHEQGDVLKVFMDLKRRYYAAANKDGKYTDIQN